MCPWLHNHSLVELHPQVCMYIRNYGNFILKYVIMVISYLVTTKMGMLLEIPDLPITQDDHALSTKNNVRNLRLNKCQYT